jgi:hypothetical protein
MFLIAIIAAAGMGSAPAPMVPMHVSSPRVVSAPPVSRPVNLVPVAQPALKPPPESMKREERKPDIAHIKRERPLQPSDCFVSRNEPGVGATYGIAVAAPPPPPNLTCSDVALPRLLPFY